MRGAQRDDGAELWPRFGARVEATVHLGRPTRHTILATLGLMALGRHAWAVLELAELGELEAALHGISLVEDVNFEAGGALAALISHRLDEAPETFESLRRMLDADLAPESCRVVLRAVTRARGLNPAHLLIELAAGVDSPALHLMVVDALRFTRRGDEILEGLARGHGPSELRLPSIQVLSNYAGQGVLKVWDLLRSITDSDG